MGAGAGATPRAAGMGPETFTGTAGAAASSTPASGGEARGGTRIPGLRLPLLPATGGGPAIPARVHPASGPAAPAQLLVLLPGIPRLLPVCQGMRLRVVDRRPALDSAAQRSDAILAPALRAAGCWPTGRSRLLAHLDECFLGGSCVTLHRGNGRERGRHYPILDFLSVPSVRTDRCLHRCEPRRPVLREPAEAPDVL
jgi:hypothetical protein